MIKKKRTTYHHGNLAESLLDAVDNIAMKFGMEAVTLRACAKLVGVSPSSAFRHYSDKRDLMTAFAVRALNQMAECMEKASKRSVKAGDHAFLAVGLAYITFALEKPALFRAMWNEETLYSGDENYQAASDHLASYLQGGFADTIDDADPADLSAEEVLAWSAVHGLANLMVDGALYRDKSIKMRQRRAKEVLEKLAPVFDPD